LYLFSNGIFFVHIQKDCQSFMQLFVTDWQS
jgi:hypothetical protein